MTFHSERIFQPTLTNTGKPFISTDGNQQGRRSIQKIELNLRAIKLNLPISRIIKLSGLRRKWRLQASLMTSTSSCGPLISKVNGKTHPLRRMSSKLSDNLVSIVERFASLNWSNNSNPLIWCTGFERLFSTSSPCFACSQWCCTAVDVGRKTTASTLLRTIEHFGVRSRTDLAFELIPSKTNRLLNSNFPWSALREPDEVGTVLLVL